MLIKINIKIRHKYCKIHQPTDVVLLSHSARAFYYKLEDNEIQYRTTG